jgi:hypothetical protein
VPQRIPLFCIIDCLHTSVYISVQLCGQQYIVLLLYCNYYDDVTPMDSSTGLRTVVCIHWNALLEMKTHTQHTNMRSCSGERLGILGLLLVPWRHKGWPYLCTHEKNTRIRMAGGVQRALRTSLSPTQEQTYFWATAQNTGEHPQNELAPSNKYSAHNF